MKLRHCLSSSFYFPLLNSARPRRTLSARQKNQPIWLVLIDSRSPSLAGRLCFFFQPTLQPTLRSFKLNIQTPSILK